MADKYATTRFNQAPSYHGKRRTRFDLSRDETTTMSTGEFVPVFYEEVYPGETHTMNMASLTRLETSLHQTMDLAYGEYAFFFVPWRIVWDNWDKFLGANDDPWDQQTAYTVPQLRLTSNNGAVTITTGSLLHHLGIPSGSYGSGINNPFISISLLPLRAIFQIWNDYYRDENYDSIVYFSKSNSSDNAAASYTFNGSSFGPAGNNLRVNRFHDLFSTSLPAPQKGSPVSIGLSGSAPVVAKLGTGSALGIGGEWKKATDLSSLGYEGTIKNADIGTSLNDPFAISTDGTNTYGIIYDPAGTLEADLSNATAITINQLRLAIAAQAIKERDARGGTRYKEIIENTWHIECPDARLDRAEFLGGKRFPINMMEVLQTSETGVTVLGSDAGHSKTADYSDGFARTFLEHGCIIGFFYTRTRRSYSQGINRQLFRKDKIDFYDPLMDNIGEVAVLNKEIMALKTSTAADVQRADEAFGYQEAWYELKEATSRYSGYFQPGINGTLDSMHYGDDYRDANGNYVYPAISSSWLKEGPENVDRTIAVQSPNSGFQWRVQIHFDYHATRQMDKYSIPNTFGM